LCVVKRLLFPSSSSEITIVVGVGVETGVGVEAGPGTDNPRKFESEADCGVTVDCWVHGSTIGVD